MTEKKYIGLITALLVIVVALLVVSNLDVPTNPNTKTYSDGINTFDSLEDMKSFLKENSESSDPYGYGGIETFGSRDAAIGVPSIAQAESADSGTASANVKSSDYSETNIQVQGVDEPDIVKNDGKYIYTVTDNKVVIVDAYPPNNMNIVSEIKLKNSNDYIRDIFINDNKLIIFAQGYDQVAVPYESDVIGAKPVSSEEIAVDSVDAAIAPSRYYPRSTPKTYIYIYDISDKANPELDSDISSDGNYLQSRLINDYVYVITTKYIDFNNPMPPVFALNGLERITSPGEIHYFDSHYSNYVFTNILAINSKSGDFNSEVYMTGHSSNVYVSQDNIYLTYRKNINTNDYLKGLMEELIRLLPSDEQSKAEKILNSDKENSQKYREIQEIIADHSNSLKGDAKAEFDKKLSDTLTNFQAKIAKEYEKTVIHKINVDNDEITYLEKGEVPGSILNQFSMDEYKGIFRVATTTGNLWQGNSLNHLYVLNEDLEIIGSVENLAKGERIYSARFLGERAYMVTFKNIDPFYVIDLSNPKDPEVLGYLKIPGYSDYLHIYDENHVIGIGKNTVEPSEDSGRENFAWYQGLKISIFDVSDVENPKEKSKIIIGDRGTDSYALRDHKAFLFDRERNILVIPVSLAKIDETKYKNQYGEVPAHAYGDHIWQGAYVLNMDLDKITVRGKITHVDQEQEQRQWYYHGLQSIQRSLYMDNYLYTISQAKIKANNLADMSEISELEITEVSDKDYPVYYEDEVVF